VRELLLLELGHDDFGVAEDVDRPVAHRGVNRGVVVDLVRVRDGAEWNAAFRERDAHEESTSERRHPVDAFAAQIASVRIAFGLSKDLGARRSTWCRSSRGALRSTRR